ncbi:MAG TPA: hypothetical protein VJB59_02185 [Bdellovibrionota bacterium]|nr:hypothetical protein [Bdellovibrionota bacterium]
MTAISSYARTMFALGVAYALSASAFFFYPDEVFYLINVMPNVFKLAEAIPNPVERFWLVMASGLLGTLAVVSFFAARSPDIKGYGRLHILSKLISSAGFIYMFFHDKAYFAYLLGVAIDVLIALLISWKLIVMGHEAGRTSAVDPLSLPKEADFDVHS